MQPRETESSPREVAAVVTFYIVAALVMIIVNKAVLNDTPELPFTLLFLQTSIAVFLLRLLAFVNRTALGQTIPGSFNFELPMFNRGTILRILPYLCVGLIGLVFNTLCLANVDAAFFQIARGLQLPFTILISSAHMGQTPPKQIILSAFIVTFGFLVGSMPTLLPVLSISSISDSAGHYLSRQTAVALIYGCISSFVLALHAVLKKSALVHVGQSVIALCYFGNLFMAVGMIPCMVVNAEFSLLYQRFLEGTTDWTTFAVGSAVTGVFGFLLGISSALSIKVTNPVTHMFSSAAKGVFQTFLGMWLFSDILTLSRAYSIAIITGGTVYFTYLQTRPKPRERLAGPQNDVEKQMDSEKQILLEKNSDSQA